MDFSTTLSIATGMNVKCSSSRDIKQLFLILFPFCDLSGQQLSRDTDSSQQHLAPRITVQLWGHVCLDTEILSVWVFFPSNSDEGEDASLLF